jgi:hypothetical protein
MASDVYFCPGTRKYQSGREEAIARELANRVWFGDDIRDKRVLVKVHVGEIHNDPGLEVTTHIRPPIVRHLVSKVKENGGYPIFGDSTPVYGFGKRCKPDGHRIVAVAHGFGENMMGAPFVVLDERGSIQVTADRLGEIGIPIVAYEIGMGGGYMVVAAHATGHPLTSLPANALKQLGMGCVDREGKIRVHGDYRAYVDPAKCKGCESCVDACAGDYIGMVEQKARVDDDCIGCGGCVDVCENGALTLIEKPELGLKRQVREALYRNLMHAAKAAASVFGGGDGRIVYFSDATEITPHCDCFELGEPHENVCEDIGVLASRNPVALDAAILHLAEERAGGEARLQRRLKEQFPNLYVEIPFDYQLQFAQSIGLGNMDYALHVVK